MTITTETEITLCRSDMGDGGWSLHAGDSDDAPILCSGESDRDADGRCWVRPDVADYREATRALRQMVGR